MNTGNLLSARRELATERRRSSRGFTLIEALVAGFVLTVSSVAFAAVIAQGKHIVDLPREEHAARSAIASVFAEIAGTPYDQLSVRFDGADFVVPGLRPVDGDDDGMCGEIAFDYGPNGEENVYTVTTRVRWRGTAGDRSIDVVRYLANVRGDTGTPPPLE